MEGWHSFIHPKWCSHAGTFPSFDKINYHQNSEDTTLSNWYFSSTVYVWKHYWEKLYFPFDLETTGVFSPMQGKKTPNNGYFLWTLLLNGYFLWTLLTSPARHKRLERTGISTIQMTVFTCCLQFILFSFTRYLARGTKKSVALYAWKRKCASCRGAKMNPLATFFTHTFIQSFNSNTQQNKLYLLRHCLWLNFPCSQLMLQRNKKFSFWVKPQVCHRYDPLW